MNEYGYYPQYGYQNYQQTYRQPAQPQQAQSLQDDRIWVASEAAAEAYPMGANSFLRLWDSNQPVFYEKRSDLSGRPYPLIAYEYKVRGAAVPEPSAPTENYSERIAALDKRLARLEKLTEKESTEDE